MTGKQVEPSREQGNDSSRGPQQLSARNYARAVMFDLVPAPLVVMDRNHTIVDLNKAAADVAGRSLDSCIGLKFWDLFDNPGCRAGTCAASDAVRTGNMCTEAALPKIQGREISVRVIATPIYDEQRQIIGVVELIYPEKRFGSTNRRGCTGSSDSRHSPSGKVLQSADLSSSCKDRPRKNEDRGSIIPYPSTLGIGKAMRTSCQRSR